MIEDQMEVNRIAYKRTKNPVYVWLSLRFLSPILRDILVEDGAELPPRLSTPPGWCMEYLVSCANSVDSLCQGHTAKRSRREFTHGGGLLSHGQKIEALPAEFGFSSPGWNAFAHYDSIFSMKWVERYFWELRDQGLSYSESLAETAERYGFQDERSLRRRLAKRRAVYLEPTEEEPEEGET